MKIANYTPQQPPAPLLNKIKELFLMQKPREFKVEKPAINQPSSFVPPLPTSQNQVQRINVETPLKIKTKLIKKINGKKVHKQKQQKVQKMYNNYLLNFLNMTTVESVRRTQYPLLSLLESQDQGDYPQLKKQHPHYSNVIKLTQIPKQQKIMWIPKVLKKTQPQHFNIQQNIVFKVKVVRSFFDCLTRLGIDEFQPIATHLNISDRAAKLLFDLLDDYFQVENILTGRSEKKHKQMKKLRRYTMSAISKYKDRTTSSIYIHLEEEYISLKEIRICLNSKIEDERDSDSDIQ